jgi:hypothetical protein
MRETDIISYIETINFNLNLLIKILNLKTININSRKTIEQFLKDKKDLLDVILIEKGLLKIEQPIKTEQKSDEEDLVIHTTEIFQIVNGC